jgi:hypothetical protein
MMWLLGFICGAAFTGAIAAAVLIKDIRDRDDAHARYVREYQRAAYNWRHPRAKRRLKNYPAPLPLKWW